jgi:hypothetical protein
MPLHSKTCLSLYWSKDESSNLGVPAGNSLIVSILGLGSKLSAFGFPSSAPSTHVKSSFCSSSSFGAPAEGSNFGSPILKQSIWTNLDHAWCHHSPISGC